MSHVSPADYPASKLYCDEAVNDAFSSNDVVCNFTSSTTCDFPVDEHDQSSIDNMFTSELDQMLEFDLLQHKITEVYHARCDAINWMFKVHAYYNFKPHTAYLSVKYLDRFLLFHALPQGKRWAWQLLSVACLSLAAKLEEINVPNLLDLQVLEPRFMFKPRTIQRMELLVMANLKWRLHFVTPFNFLEYFIAKLLCFNNQFDQFSNLFSCASDLILCTCRVIELLDYTPSAIAAAAVLCATGQDVDDHKSICFHERVNNEMVKKCGRLFKEHSMKMCRPTCSKQQFSKPMSPSPVRILDAASSGSCETQKFAHDDSL